MCAGEKRLPAARHGEVVIEGGAKGVLNALAEGKEACLGSEPEEARKVAREKPVLLRERRVPIPGACAEVGECGAMYQ